MIRSVVRALAALISLISLVFGAASPAAALASPTFVPRVAATTAPTHSTVLAETATERGGFIQ